MELAKSNLYENEESQNEGNLRAMGEYEIEKPPQVPELQELVQCITNETERGEFDPPSFRKVIKSLYLPLNSNDGKGLGSLISLLLKHGLILS